MGFFNYSLQLCKSLILNCSHICLGPISLRTAESLPQSILQNGSTHGSINHTEWRNVSRIMVHAISMEFTKFDTTFLIKLYKIIDIVKNDV